MPPFWLLVFVGAAVAEISDVTITSRADWGASPSATPLQRISNSSLPVPYVVIHSSPSFACPVNKSCAENVRRIQEHAIKNKGFPDLSFNFLVSPDGEIFEGRGWSMVGSHAPGYNSRSCGICIIGNYTVSEPSSSAMTSVQNLINAGVAAGHISNDYRLVGHRQVRPRDCPGDGLYSVLQKWPHWYENPVKFFL